jgi:diguanylate cyclase (GGDEF)-like protein/PAS domain S-box-containing protein
MYSTPENQTAADVSLDNDRFHALFVHSPMPCQILTPAGKTILVNKSWMELWGFTEDFVRNVFLDTYNILEDAYLESTGVTPLLRRAFAGEAVNIPASYYDPAVNQLPGRGRWVKTYLLPVNNGSHQVQELIMIQEDITEQKQAEEDLRTAANRYKALTQAAPVGIFETTPDGDCTYVNDRWSAIAGMSLEQARGKRWKTALHPDDAEWTGTLWYETACSGSVFKAEYRFMRPDGTVTWVYGQGMAIRNDIGDITGYVGTVTDITDQKHYEEALRRQATVDNLTGLPNRMTALDRLTLAMHQAHRDHHHTVLMFVDLDHFKHINDSMGHPAGDQLLRQVAARLQACVREGHTVARFGGDEFLVIMPEVLKVSHAELVAQRVQKAFEQPYVINGQEVFTSASLGLAVYPEDGSDSDSLLCHADAAMYRAKEQGRNTYCFFLQEMNQISQERLSMETQLRYALEREEFVVHYQPIIDCNSGKLVSIEGLLRWHNPVLGLIVAERFIPLAEETGLIVPIGEWALNTACAEVQQWMNRTGQKVRLAINLSPRQFKTSSIIDTVKAALSSSGLSANCLELELTERMLIMEDAEATLQAFRDLGISLSIDDFGTGYSSLGYLTRLPVSHLKVDRGFIQQLPQHKESAIVARAIIALSHSLGLQVIGEGVEKEEQLRFLQEEGCDYVQGLYFSPALTIDQLENWAALGYKQKLLAS